MKKIRHCLLCLCILQSVLSSLGALEEIRVAVPDDVYKDYQAFLKGRDALHINSYKGQHMRRDVVEVILVQQALALGGMPIKPKFIPVNSYARIQVQLSQGQILMAMNSMWDCDLERWKKDVFMSTPVIRNGEFEAGIYTLKGREDVLSVQNLEQLQSFRAISNESWTVDWKTLQNLKLKSLESTTQWTSMVKMLGAKRADFTLAPFQANKDLSLQTEGLTFVPVPNIKVSLAGSRHFAVAKNYVKGGAYFEALNKGIAKMREQGLIRRAYIESGFFNQAVKDWTLINKPSR